MSYIGSTPTTQSFIAGTDYFNGNGSTVNFTLSRSVNSVNDIEVIVNNVEQIPSGYSVSGTTLTFSAAPSAGTSNVYVRYLSTTNLSLAIPAGTSATFNTVTVADGSATTPSITNDGDTNTGIFFPAADTIAFAEGGVEAARFDSAGNLGIGATTINNAVTTYRGAGVNNYIQFTNATTGTASTDGCLIGVAADDTSLRLRVLEAASMIFTTSDTERARIDSSGNLLVGTTSSDITAVGIRLMNNNQLQTSKSGDWSLRMGRRDSTGIIAEIYYNSSRVGDIATNGTGTTYNSASDYRLKEDIVPMTGALARNALLNPVKYKWKIDGSEGEGFVADQLQGSFPSAVTGEKDAVDADGNAIYQSIGTGPLDGHFAACVNELQAIIQEQQAIITALTTRVEMLENNNATQ